MLLQEICWRNTERALVAGARMPSWPDNARYVPNRVLRSALFGASGRGKRKFLRREPIASIEGTSIV